MSGLGLKNTLQLSLAFVLSIGGNIQEGSVLGQQGTMNRVSRSEPSKLPWYSSPLEYRPQITRPAVSSVKSARPVVAPRKVQSIPSTVTPSSNSLVKQVAGPDSGQSQNAREQQYQNEGGHQPSEIQQQLDAMYRQKGLEAPQMRYDALPIQGQEDYEALQRTQGQQLSGAGSNQPAVIRQQSQQQPQTTKEPSLMQRLFGRKPKPVSQEPVEAPSTRMRPQWMNESESQPAVQQPPRSMPQGVQSQPQRQMQYSNGGRSVQNPSGEGLDYQQLRRSRGAEPAPPSAPLNTPPSSNDSQNPSNESGEVPTEQVEQPQEQQPQQSDEQFEQPMEIQAEQQQESEPVGQPAAQGGEGGESQNTLLEPRPRAQPGSVNLDETPPLNEGADKETGIESSTDSPSTGRGPAQKSPFDNLELHTPAEQSPQDSSNSSSVPEAQPGVNPVITPGNALPAARPLVELDDEEQAEKYRILSAFPELTGLKGFCPVVLRDERELIRSKRTITSSYEGVEYQFSSREAKKKFEKTPEKYLPVTGGNDVVLLRDGKSLAGSLDFGAWYRGRLYLFANAQNLESFVQEPATFEQLAMKGVLPEENTVPGEATELTVPSEENETESTPAEGANQAPANRSPADLLRGSGHLPVSNPTKESEITIPPPPESSEVDEPEMPGHKNAAARISQLGYSKRSSTDSPKAATWKVVTPVFRDLE